MRKENRLSLRIACSAVETCSGPIFWSARVGANRLAFWFAMPACRPGRRATCVPRPESELPHFSVSLLCVS